MPVVASQFAPPFFLRNGHVQTILPALLGRKARPVYKRERLETSDGDFLDLDWLRAGHSRLAILSHGLEGSSSDSYIRGHAATLQAAGWDVLAWNFRGCSGEMNRLLRFYHSGETTDLAAVITHAEPAYAQIAPVGFSLGGNMLLKYLGEGTTHPKIVAAAALSVPIHLASSAQNLDERRMNRIYLGRFMRALVGKVESKARHFPELDVRGARGIRSFAEFDDRYTARVHGFRDAMDYWTQSSARQFLPGIRVRTLLLNALDDPFLDENSFPFAEAGANKNFHFEAPPHGGHIGFVENISAGPTWAERRVAEFLAG